MTHFLLLVLVDGSETDPATRAETVMERYWGAEPFDEDGHRIADWKCDGFTIGKRYDGMIWGQEQQYGLRPDEFQRRYGLDVVRPEDNIRPVREVVADLLPFALVLPDGRWIDAEGRVERDWREVVQDVLAEHAEGIAVAVDCHC